MITASEFNQLISILPSLETFSLENELDSISLVKFPYEDKSTDLYLLYTQPNKNHGLDMMSQIGHNFRKLWGISNGAEIITTAEKYAIGSETYEELLKPSELILIFKIDDKHYSVASPDQVIKFANHNFGITVQPYTSVDDVTLNTPKKRKISDEKTKFREEPIITSNNFFTKIPLTKSQSVIESQLQNLTIDECKNYIRGMSQQFGVENLNVIQLQPYKK